MTYRPVNDAVIGLKDAISKVRTGGWQFNYRPVQLTGPYVYGLFVQDPSGNELDVVMESRIEIKTFNKVQSLVNFHFENTVGSESVTIPKLPDQLEVRRT